MTKLKLYVKLFEQCVVFERLQEVSPLTEENQRRLEHIKKTMADIEYDL